MGTSVTLCDTFPQTSRVEVGLIPGMGRTHHCVECCGASISASATCGHAASSPKSLHLFSFRSVRFYGTEAAEIADAMLDALSLTLLATSASLDHPCGSYRSATRE